MRLTLKTNLNENFCPKAKRILRRSLIIIIIIKKFSTHPLVTVGAAKEVS
jgi:hypothetical protein